MSNSRLHFTTLQGTAELIVRDGRLQEVARGFGCLDSSLPPGIYEIEGRSGGASRRQLVSLAAGERQEISMDLPFASPVPLEGTSTSREQHRGAVADLAQKPVRGYPGRAGSGRLLLVIRRLDREDSTPLPAEIVADWVLLDASGQPVPVFQPAFRDCGPACVGVCLELPEGGYQLCMKGRRLTLNRSLWIAPDWTTGVFAPGEDSGARYAHASILLTRPSVGFPGFDNDAHAASRVAEVALAALREGRTALPTQEINARLTGAFSNPMLGILAAHSLLRQRSPKLEALTGLLENLNRLIPRHPDLVALAAAAADRFGDKWNGPMPATPVTWPPMLAASFQALLLHDTKFPNTIPADSPAEQAAPFVVRDGLWTTWREPVCEPETLEQPEKNTANIGEPPSFRRSVRKNIELWPPALAEKLPQVFAADDGRFNLLRSNWPAMSKGESAALREVSRRVGRFVRDLVELDSVRDAREVLLTIDPKELAAELLLPLGLVETCLTRTRPLLHNTEKLQAPSQKPAADTIIDLGKTHERLQKAYSLIEDKVASGGNVLFVGTKEQVREIVREAATSTGMPFCVDRWLGGTLTNFATVKKSIAKLKKYQQQEKSGELAKLSAKEEASIKREMVRMTKNFSGILEMTELPAIVFVVDASHEAIAVAEARRSGIPCVGLVDTNSDPTQLSHPIPGNDDAVKSVRIILDTIAAAVQAGLAQRESLRTQLTSARIPAFKVGDRVKVHTKVREGDKERTQLFAGIVIARKGHGIHETFIVRRISYGEGVERVFPVNSPNIEKIEVDRQFETGHERRHHFRNLKAKTTMQVEVKRTEASA